jgi:hypothetical protein
MQARRPAVGHQDERHAQETDRGHWRQGELYYRLQVAAGFALIPAFA